MDPKPSASEGRESCVESQSEPAKKMSCAKILLRAIFTVVALAFLSYQGTVAMIKIYRYSSASSFPSDKVCDSNGLLLNGNCVLTDDWATAESPYVFDGEGGVSKPRVSHTTFNLQVQSKTISFISKSSLSGGSLRIITSLNQPRDLVTFNVTRTLVKEVNIHRDDRCIKKLGQIGIELNDTQFYSTTIILPEPEDVSDMAHFDGLYIDISHTVLEIGDIGSKVFFENVFVNANDASPISVDSITGGSIEVQSAGGAIRGTYNSTSFLKLSTTNAPILVDVNLKIDTTRGKYDIPSLQAKTSNSPVEATVNLFGPEKSRFTVIAETSNSPVGLKFPTSPLDPTLHIRATTSNSPATVVTHPTFQGTFQLSTTVADASVDLSRDTNDPSGEGRRRQFQYTEIVAGSLKGEVHWGDNSRDTLSSGSVVIETSNSPATLLL